MCNFFLNFTQKKSIRKKVQPHTVRHLLGMYILYTYTYIVILYETNNINIAENGGRIDGTRTCVPVPPARQTRRVFSRVKKKEKKENAQHHCETINGYTHTHVYTTSIYAVPPAVRSESNNEIKTRVENKLWLVERVQGDACGGQQESCVRIMK